MQYILKTDKKVNRSSFQNLPLCRNSPKHNEITNTVIFWSRNFTPSLSWDDEADCQKNVVCKMCRSMCAKFDNLGKPLNSTLTSPIILTVSVISV